MHSVPKPRTRMSTIARPFVPVFLALLATGCGGRGASSTAASGSSATNAPTAQVAVSSANGNLVAGAAFQGANNAAGTGIQSTSALGLVGTQSGLPDLAVLVGQQFTALQSFSQNMTTIAGVSASCPAGGTMSYSGTLSAGSTITVSLSSCNMGDGYIESGSYSLNLSGYSMTDANDWMLAGSMSYSNLTITGTNINETLNGELTLSETDSSGTISASLSSSSSLESAASGGPSLWLENFSITAQVDPTGTTTFHGSGSIADSALNGYVSFNIPSSNPFIEAPGDLYPSSGTMTITGSNSTSVVVTAVSNTQCTLAVNGDAPGAPVDWTSIVP